METDDAEKVLEENPWPQLEEIFTYSGRKGDSVQMQCKLCLPAHAVISAYKTSASNLKKHIERKHPSKIELYDGRTALTKATTPNKLSASGEVEAEHGRDYRLNWTPTDTVWRMSSPIYYNQDSVTRFKKRKARFSFSEVHILLDEVRKHRMVVVGKFNRGVPTDMKKRTWAEITARVNEIGECQREVIEVIKKWSDLKCDTKRKVAAMRSGTVPNRGLNSRLSRDLNQTEKIVLQILEMDEEDQSMADFGPLGEDDDVPEEEEEMEEEDMMGMQNSPNSGLDLTSAPPPPSSGQTGDSSQPPFDVQYDVPPTEDTEAVFAESDDEQKEEAPPSTEATKLTEDHQGNNGIQNQGLAAESSEPSTSTSTAAPILPGPPSQNLRDSMLHNASLSLQEQHATNILLETVSRSLELLAESVQQLAETQQEFVRESLQLQRETVQVLRDFTGGAIALMHDKLNGRPAL